jgi:hypothetical protein
MNATNNNIQPPIKFTKEEEQLMIECRDEAFYRRCVPLCIISNVLLGVAFKKNLTSNNNKILKYALATIIPYSIGKASYINECKEKVKSRLSPESKLYKLMIEGKYEALTVEPTNSSIYDELRDRNRAKQPVDYSNLSTYDEMRMRNRGNIPEQQQEQPQKQIVSTSDTKSNKTYKVNKFGDIIYDD